MRLSNKQYKTHNALSRYSVYPIYYETSDKYWIGGITGQLSTSTASISHTISKGDTLDSLALYYYGNPTYFWVIADYNRIQDAFIDLIVGNTIKIPTLSAIEFEGI